MLLLSKNNAAGLSYVSHLLCSHFLDRILHASNVRSQRISTCATAIDKEDDTNFDQSNQDILQLFYALCSFRSFAAHLQWVSAQQQWLSIQLLQSPDCLAAWAQYQWKQLPNECPGLEAGLLIYPGTCSQTDGCLAGSTEPLMILSGSWDHYGYLKSRVACLVMKLWPASTTPHTSPEAWL